MWQAIEREITAVTGAPFRVRDSTAIGGGCINDAVCLRDENRTFFVKLNRAEWLSMFAAEAAGLAAIRATATVRAPEPVAWGTDGQRCWLALEFIEFAAATGDTEARLGEQLAAMHRTGGDRFGWDRDNTIGSTPQPNPWTSQWPQFFQEQRLGFQLALARDNGLTRGVVDRGELLLASLPAFFSDYRPVPSLLHGDLWGGNWSADGEGRPVLFDPAVYFGDREADLAMTGLFGGFGERFYRAYNAAWPLDDGYATRKVLYNLYHVLNHFNLFGGGYDSQARDMVERLLAELGR
jgi:protein-ribulosamine 3-kinase